MDTNVFSELVKSQPDASVVKWLRDHEPRLYISTLTIGEIRRGIVTANISAVMEVRGCKRTGV